MGKFEPTHIIDYRLGGHSERLIVSLVEGVAYSAGEWHGDLTADFTKDEDTGEWLFQGQPFSGRVEKIGKGTKKGGSLGSLGNGPEWNIYHKRDAGSPETHKRGPWFFEPSDWSEGEVYSHGYKTLAQAVEACIADYDESEYVED